MGRLLVAASSVQGPRREFSKIANQNSPAVMRSQASAISTAMGSGVPSKVLLTTRETMAAAGVVLRQWQDGFRNDWKVTVNAINFSQMKKSLLHWFREPVSSKRMASSKNQTV
jgi:hypothetical protein